MSTYIDITLINFKCHLNKKIRLVQGSNLIKGDSGKGKSTICKAIQFVLYGGRKFKDVQNWLHTKERTEVIFHYTSPTIQYRITRIRPSESLLLQLQDSTGFYEIRDLAAQEWINSNYGVENIWLAASYISRKKAHFLLEANNNDKMELLQRIAFGDISELNQPEYYLQKTKVEIYKYNEELKKLNENMRIQQCFKTSIISRNPQVTKSEYISSEMQKEINNELLKSHNEMRDLQQLFVSIRSRREIANQLSLIIIPDSCEKEIEEIKMIKEKIRLIDKTKDFDIDILENNIDEDHFLYMKYKEHGFKSNIQQFLFDKKKEYESYIDSLNNRKRNEEILQLNSSLKREYDINMIEYNKIKSEIGKLSSNIEVYKINSDDDLSYSYIISLIYKIKEEYEEIKRKHYEYKIQNSHIEINNRKLFSKYTHEKKLHDIYINKLKELNDKIDSIKLNKIKDEDDLSYQWILKYQDDILNKIKDLEIKIEEIKNYNSGKTDLNNAFRKAYDKQMSDYNEIISSIGEYENNKKRLESLMEESNSDIYIKISELDDLTSSWLIGFKAAINISLKELICPNCNRGLIYENDTLILGKLECGNSKEKYRKQLSLIDLEYNKRVKREKLLLEINDFNKITPRIKPELPELPKYHLLKEFKLGKDDINELIEKYKSIDLKEEISNRETMERLKKEISSLQLVGNPIKPNLESLIIYDSDEIEMTEEKLNEANKQLLSRSNVDKLKKITLPKLPEIPQYYELLNVRDISETKLKTFDIPKYNYDKYLSMYKSKSLIEDYLNLKKMDHVIIRDISNYDSLLIKQKQRNELIKNKEKLESLLLTLPEDDVDIENKISSLNDKINSYNFMLSVAQSFREIESVDIIIKQLSDQINSLIKYLEILEYFYNKTEQISMSILEKKIIDVNTPLASILQDLFIDPIDVRLTPYKELKNGDTKLQINFIIDYKGMTLGNMDGFSDGEEGRLSLSLLIAFSRMNNNPFIIIDEVLSSMNDKLKTESIDLVDKWTAGKFVIHICHSVVEGQHYNVIEL